MNKIKLIVISSIANTFEWYDYALFAHFTFIISQKYFPHHNASTSILQSFLVFAIGYLMRPIGGIFFGIIGDKFGRKIALSSALICMAIPTITIGILPTYHSIGYTATILMILIRMMQGLSMGGTLTGSITFIVEHIQQYKGLASSFSISSICLGMLLGSTISSTIKKIFSNETFELWAWRLPFIIGILIFFIGMYIKTHIPETPVFKNTIQNTKISLSFKEIIQKYWSNIIISILINSTGSIIFYLETIYLSSYLITKRQFTELNINNLINICYIIMIFIIPISGWLSDNITRQNILIINNIIILLFITFIIKNIEHGNLTKLIFAQITLCILAAIYIGSEPALQTALFPTHIRNTALSLSYNSATSIFGGITPFIAEKTTQSTGTLNFIIIYIIISSICSLYALYAYKKIKKH